MRSLGGGEPPESAVGEDSDVLAQAASVIAVIQGLRQQVGPAAAPEARTPPETDLAAVHEERDRMAHALEEARAQVERAVQERDSLAERLRRAEQSIETLEREKRDLEAKVAVLEDKLEKWAQFVGQFP